MTDSPEGPLQCPCAGRFLVEAWRYDEPPAGEPHYLDGEYRRAVECCGLCGHYVSRHEVDAELYRGDYHATAHGALRATFDRIMALPEAESDNAGRVRRVVAFAEGRLQAGASVLDVGSGLCVFLARLQAHGFAGTALDPDPAAVEHARSVGVDAIEGDFRSAAIDRTFELVTFNKVLEHVEDPVAMLAAARPLVAAGGYVYVEVPDGESAAADGPHREEFFFDHLHVFSLASLALLAARAGFAIVQSERLREPSTKYTLAAFLRDASPGPAGP